MTQMADETFTLTTFYTAWKAYQDHISAALAPLTSEQLGLRPAPGIRSLGENALHIIGCRVFWFTEVMGEDGGEGMRQYQRWNQAALEAPYSSWNALGQALGTSAPTGAELAQGIDFTWRFMAERLARWTTADMRQTFADEEDGKPIELSRAWVVWHVLEHDLHHGGEVSLTLGMHGIAADFPG